MNCFKCGSPMVPGQKICSSCDTDNTDYINQQTINQTTYQNSNQVQNEYVNNVNNQNINNNEYSNYYAQSNPSDDSNLQTETVTKNKQNACLKIASIIALIAGAAMLISTGSNLFITIGLGKFDITNILGILVSILFVFYAFFISNFNLGKSKLFDNKVLFVILLLINLLVSFLYNIYIIVFVFALIGYIMSIKK